MDALEGGKDDPIVFGAGVDSRLPSVEDNPMQLCCIGFDGAWHTTDTKKLSELFQGEFGSTCCEGVVYFAGHMRSKMRRSIIGKSNKNIFILSNATNQLHLKN